MDFSGLTATSNIYRLGVEIEKCCEDGMLGWGKPLEIDIEILWAAPFEIDIIK